MKYVKSGRITDSHLTFLMRQCFIPRSSPAHSRFDLPYPAGFI